MEWAFNSYYTLIAATLVLLVGKVLVKKIKILRDFNIPEPVAGGLIAAIILFALHEAYGVSFKFEKPLQNAFMLIFFTSIGLSADFSRLKAGGLPLVVFTAIVGGFLGAKLCRGRTGYGFGFGPAHRSDYRFGVADGRTRHVRCVGT